MDDFVPFEYQIYENVESGGEKYDPKLDPMEHKILLGKNWLDNNQQAETIKNEMIDHINLRNSNEGYSTLNPANTYTIKDEAKNNHREKIEGIELETSPIIGLVSKRKNLYFLIKELKMELEDGVINSQEFKLEGTILRLEINALSKVIELRTQIARDEDSDFRLIGVVFNTGIEEQDTYYNKLHKIQKYLEAHHQRDVQMIEFTKNNNRPIS